MQTGIELYDRIKVLREASAVKRCHTIRTLYQRSVAEHSHGIVLTLLVLYEKYGAVPSSNLLAAACCHDLSEIETGDVPAPTKWKYPAIKAAVHEASREWEDKHGMRYTLTDSEARCLGWADAFDFGLYALEEITMGNRFLEVPIGRIYRRLNRIPLGEVNGDVSVAFSMNEELMHEMRSKVSMEILKKEA